MSEENVLSNKIEMKKVWQLLGIIAVTALIWNLPITCFGIEGLTVIQQRVIAIFVFADTHCQIITDIRNNASHFFEIVK